MSDGILIGGGDVSSGVESQFVDQFRGPTRWTLQPHLADELFEGSHLAVNRWLESGMARVVKSGRHRTVYALELSSGQYFLKHFRITDWRTVGQSLIRPSRATLEWRAAHRVAAAGVPTIECVAFGETRRAGLVADSYLVTRAIENVVPVDDFLRETFPRLTSSRQTRVRQVLARQTAAIIGRLHRHGLFHPDLHPGNLLVSPAELGEIERGDEGVTMWLIDLHALGSRRRISTRRAVTDLTLLHNFFARRSTPSDRLRFFDAYWFESPAAERVGNPSYGRFLSRLTTACRRELQRADCRGDRKWQRDNRRLILRRTSTRDGRALASLGADFVRDFCERPEALLETIRMDGTPVPVRLPATMGIPAARLTHWNRVPPGFVAEFRTPARQAWEMGHALLRRQVSAVCPLALVESRKDGSAWLLEQIPPHAQPLAARNSPESTPGLTRNFRTLHGLGFDYVDWTPADVLVNNQNSLWWDNLHRIRRIR